LMNYSIGNDNMVFRCPEGTEPKSVWVSGAHVVIQKNVGSYPKHEIYFAQGPNCHVTDNGNGSYDFGFETGEYVDWNDLTIHIQENADGTTTIKVTAMDTGIDGWVYSPLGDLMALTKDQQITTSLTSYKTDKMPFSYGMNSQAGKIDKDAAQRILALDYHKNVADVAGPQHADTWKDSVAPRHMRSVNVLYADYSVRTVDPDDINPEYTDGTKNPDGTPYCPYNVKYWTPVRGIIDKNLK